MHKKQYLIRILCVLALVVLIVVGVILFQRHTSVPVVEEELPQESVVVQTSSSTMLHTIIGTSVENRQIEAYTFGTGDVRLLFVGGMHGGYEWNSTLLAYAFIDHFTTEPTLIPNDIAITIIPTLNPDGLARITGKEGRFSIADVKESSKVGDGRFNAHDVDLNRNFDCKWKPESTWRGNIVSAGDTAFSEPEALALKNFVVSNAPHAVIFWHSQSNAVYASECMNGILPDTVKLMNTYANAGGYPSVDSFDAYPISGDAEGWLASINIPAITVELSTHETIEWEKNLAGVDALIEAYSLAK